jgi:hypothetical protein
LIHGGHNKSNKIAKNYGNNPEKRDINFTQGPLPILTNSKKQALITS